MYSKSVFYNKLDEFSNEGTPYFFAIDFLQENFIFSTLEDLKHQDKIQVVFPNFTYKLDDEDNNIKIDLQPNGISFSDFFYQFNEIQQHIQNGNTYLTNLSFEVQLQNKLNLESIFHQAKAKYKILIKDKFVCFSPETFIQINENRLVTFPMKGTIDAVIPNAKEILFSSEKETAEHHTIVDLLRNDISQVCKNVRVNKFRYVDEIQTQNRNLFQTSSEIQGEIREEFEGKIGSILQKLLPAGSISGAPKKKTVEIIQQVETHKRGFYTGIAGIFDGKNLDTCVLIRYIEKMNDKFYYKTGAGIHLKSDVQEEFQELKNKIYVPIF